MHAADGDEDEDVPVDVFTTLAQAASKLLVSGKLPALPATFNSGVKVRELSVSDRVDDMINDMLGGMKRPSSSSSPELMLEDYKNYKKFK